MKRAQQPTCRVCFARIALSNHLQLPVRGGAVTGASGNRWPTPFLSPARRRTRRAPAAVRNDVGGNEVQRQLHVPPMVLASFAAKCGATRVRRVRAPAPTTRASSRARSRAARAMTCVPVADRCVTGTCNRNWALERCNRRVAARSASAESDPTAPHRPVIVPVASSADPQRVTARQRGARSLSFSKKLHVTSFSSPTPYCCR